MNLKLRTAEAVAADMLSRHPDLLTPYLEVIGHAYRDLFSAIKAYGLEAVKAAVEIKPDRPITREVIEVRMKLDFWLDPIPNGTIIYKE